MSSFEFNKLMAAFLSTALFAMVVGIIADALYEPEHLEQNAYVVAGVGGDAAATKKAPEPEKPFPVLLAQADPKAGEKLSSRCKACHSFDEGGPNKVGPNLWDIVGRPVAGHEGFSYSGALGDMGGEWDYDKLNGFLESPRDFAPGTKMSFAGLRKPADRAAIIAYLRTLSENPAPLPEVPADSETSQEAATPSNAG